MPLLAELERHMTDFHDTSVRGFTVYELLAEHLMLHQYAHGIPDKGTPHDNDHEAIGGRKGDRAP